MPHMPPCSQLAYNKAHALLHRGSHGACSSALNERLAPPALTCPSSLHFSLRDFGPRVCLRAGLKGRREYRPGCWAVALCALSGITASKRSNILGAAAESSVIAAAERRRSAARLQEADVNHMWGRWFNVSMRRRPRRLGTILSRPTIMSSC